jgi:tmRNA-binding protein
VPLRPFLPDVTLLAQHQHDDSMPIISFLVFVNFKVQKKIFFLVSKSDRKSDKKSDKKRQNTDKHPHKNRTLEKSDSCRYFFWPVGAHRS